jgi:hypothetical protein
MSGLKTAFAIFWTPLRALATAADERRYFWPFLLVTLATLGFTGLSIPRTDFARAAEDALETSPDTAKLTPHEREEKVETGKKVAVVGALATATVWPTLSVVLGAFLLWLGFKVAGGAPGFVATLAILAHAQLPYAVRQLLSVPALLSRQQLAPGEAAALLPSSLAALAPDTFPISRLALLSSADLFTLLSAMLCAAGMAHVAKVSRLRSAIVVTLLWASFVAVFQFALPHLTQAQS